MLLAIGKSTLFGHNYKELTKRSYIEEVEFLKEFDFVVDDDVLVLLNFRH